MPRWPERARDLRRGKRSSEIGLEPGATNSAGRRRILPLRLTSIGPTSALLKPVSETRHWRTSLGSL